MEHSLSIVVYMQVKRVRCESSAALVPKDKAIKRFIVRNMVDASAIRDLQDSCAVEGELCLPIDRLRGALSIVSDFGSLSTFSSD